MERYHLILSHFPRHCCHFTGIRHPPSCLAITAAYCQRNQLPTHHHHGKCCVLELGVNRDDWLVFLFVRAESREPITSSGQLRTDLTLLNMSKMSWLSALKNRSFLRTPVRRDRELHLIIDWIADLLYRIMQGNWRTDFVDWRCLEICLFIHLKTLAFGIDRSSFSTSAICLKSMPVLFKSCMRS